MTTATPTAERSVRTYQHANAALAASYGVSIDALIFLVTIIGDTGLVRTRPFARLPEARAHATRCEQQGETALVTPCEVRPIARPGKM